MNVYTNHQDTVVIFSYRVPAIPRLLFFQIAKSYLVTELQLELTKETKTSQSTACSLVYWCIATHGALFIVPQQPFVLRSGCRVDGSRAEDYPSRMKLKIYSICVSACVAV